MLCGMAKGGHACRARLNVAELAWIKGRS